MGQYYGLTMTTGAGGHSIERGVARLSPRATALLAWCLCAVSLTLTTLGLFLLVVSQSPAGGPAYAGAPVFDFWLVNTVVAISFSTVGAVITPRLPPEIPIGWIFCCIGVIAGVRLFVSEYATRTLLAEPRSVPAMLPGGEVLAWISSWLWVVHIGLFVFLAFLFPDGRPPSSRWRPFGWLVGVVVVTGTVSVALWPETAAGFDLVNHPLGIEVATDSMNPVETILYALGLMAAASLLVRLRRSEGVKRQQVKWFAYAVAVLATSAILAYVVSELVGVVWLEWVSSMLVLVSVVGLPVAVGIAILRYRLYNIDLLLNRTLVYGVLTAVLAAVYFGSIVLFQVLFRTFTGQESQLAVVASTLAIAALFTPFRRRIQSFIDRRFYRRKYDARKTLEAFSAKLRTETDLDALSSDLIEVIRETMQPTSVSLWLESPERATEDSTPAKVEPEIEIAPDDPIVAYLASVSGVVGTGLVEAHDPHREMFGFPRLRNLVGTDHSGGSSLIDFLLSELTHFTGEDWEQEDDITLVTLARSEEPACISSAGRTCSTPSWRISSNCSGRPSYVLTRANISPSPFSPSARGRTPRSPHFGKILVTITVHHYPSS